MVCKSVTEIEDHAKNFPNAPRIWQNVPVLVSLFCVGNFRDIFVYFQGYRIFRKFN